MRNTLIVASIVGALTGCTATPVQPSQKESLFTFKKFNAPLGQKLEVETGEPLFVEGSYIEGQHIDIPVALDMMVPGAMFIPFPVHIGQGALKMTRITAKYRYFCADEDKAAASFPGLGSVVRSGDCIGIRIAHSDGSAEWVVDNSNYNKGMNTVWTRNMADEEKARYAPKNSKFPFKYESLKRIVFNGYYGGQLRFGWEEISENFRDSKEFIFDFSGQPTAVSIKGNHFVVHEANNIKLVYEWSKFN